MKKNCFIVGDIWVCVWLPSLPLRKYPAGHCQYPSGSKEKEHHHVEDVFWNSSRPYMRRAEGSVFPLVWEQKICSARGKRTTPLLLLLQGRGKSSRGTGREPDVWMARKHAPSYVHQLKHERSFKQMVGFFKQIFFLNPEVLCNIWEKNFLKIAQRNGLCKVHFEAEKIQLNTFLQQNTSVSYKPKASRPCAAYNAHRSVVSSSPPLPPWYYKRLLLVFVFINKRAPLQFIYNHRWTLNSILYKHLKKYWEWSMVGNIAHVASSHACMKGGEWVVSAYLQSREPPVQKRYSSWLQKGNVHKIKFFMLFYFPVLYSQSRSRFICMARCRALRYIKKEIPAPRGKSVFQKGFFLVLHKAIYVH